MRHLGVYPISGRALLPDEALRLLCRGERPFLLDGAADADGLGRYSYGGCDPVARYVDRLLDGPLPGGLGRRAQAPPLLRLQQCLAGWGPLIAVGLLGYDVGRSVERLPPRDRPDDLGLLPIDLGGYDAVYRHDRVTEESMILATSEDAAGRLRRRLLAPPPPASGSGTLGAVRFETSKDEYCRRVRRVREYLLAGDCYQVNLCHRLCARVRVEQALPLYLRLRAMAPAPLGAYLRLDPPAVGGPAPVLLSNSPELLLRANFAGPHLGRVETRPIKGTRRRDPDPARDRALAETLFAAEKDRAEHLMIVDLLRNDLGRVAVTGSVNADEAPRLVSLPTVHHLVSSVRARMLPGTGLADLLAALFPGGSITGAPKVRAMEIIDELEPVRRGPFYGALGFFSATLAELALCIRTAVVRDDELLLSVGGGIVLGSTPEEEWEETEVKAAAFLRAMA